jgi:LuxR family maltose regulon positive regulatory protein
MSEAANIDVSPSRRHIIKRPRLTNLLDETKARCILLVAPAGYGKTTLAREWLQETGRPSLWVRLSTAAVDIKAFAELVASASTAIDPALSDSRPRISPADSAEGVMSQLIDWLAAQPANALLVLDDYHVIMASSDVERAIRRLHAEAGLALLITSRRRPTWVSARDLLYGEAYELGVASLAMNDAEASAVLAQEKAYEVPGLVALAQGWPAVIGLAALSPSVDAPMGVGLPQTLYEYLAEELYSAASSPLKVALCQLALLPTITEASVAELIENPETAILEAARLGFLSPTSPHGYGLHPLLQTFLESKFDEMPASERCAFVENTIDTLIRNHEWDDAFSVIERFAEHEKMASLMESAAGQLLRQGRLATVERWVTYSVANAVISPVVDFFKAELLFREGHHPSAELLAAKASAEFPRDHPLLAKAFIRAGQAAYLDDRANDALEYHRQAREASATTQDIWDATWGAFVACIVLELDDAFPLLSELEGLPDRGVDNVLRLSSARHQVAALFGNVESVMPEIRDVAHLVTQASDPLNATSFLNILAYGSLLTARYEDAVAAANAGITYGTRASLPFAEAYALCTRGRAEVGLHDFGAAETTIADAESNAIGLSNIHCRMEAQVARAHLLIATGALDDARAVTEQHWDRLPSVAEVGEYEAIRGLVLAALADREALRLAAEAEQRTKQVAVRTLVPFVRAVFAMKTNAVGAADLVRDAFATMRLTGAVDSFIVSYRAFRPLLDVLVTEPACVAQVSEILSGAGDNAIARSYGINRAPDRREGALSPRELEVLDLLSEARSNRQIAQALFISEVTVKTHLRRIYSKLGVRTRTEAVVRRERLRRSQAD